MRLYQIKSNELNEEFNKKFNLYKEEQNIKFEKLKNDYISLKDKTCLPSPSSSTENKKEKMKK
jgi:hypothetical protein